MELEAPRESPQMETDLGLFADEQAALPGLPLGSLLTVTIIAHNEAGGSAERAPVTITLS